MAPWNRSENEEINPCTQNQNVIDKCFKNTKYEK